MADKMIYPTEGIWDGSSEWLFDGQTIPDGYTDITPPQPAYKIQFIDGKWVETATDEEIASMKLSDEEPKLQPTPEQLMIAKLTLKIAKLEAKDE